MRKQEKGFSEMTSGDALIHYICLSNLKKWRKLESFYLRFKKCVTSKRSTIKGTLNRYSFIIITLNQLSSSLALLELYAVRLGMVVAKFISIDLQKIYPAFIVSLRVFKDLNFSYVLPSFMGEIIC